jgi:hypothetical protein
MVCVFHQPLAGAVSLTTGKDSSNKEMVMPERKYRIERKGVHLLSFSSHVEDNVSTAKAIRRPVNRFLRGVIGAK